jgi:electron transfer flavoprotein alpha subunit
VANLLVHIELEATTPTPNSLAALGVGRRLASQLGANLIAVIPSAAREPVEAQAIGDTLSRRGADRLLWITHPALESTALYGTRADALQTACIRYPAQLILLPASAASRDIGPRLALDVGGHFAGDVSLVFEGGPPRYRYRAQHRRRVHEQELLTAPRPLLLALTEAEHTAVDAPQGDGGAAVTRIELDATSAPFESIVATPSRGGSRRLTLGAGGGLTARGFELLRELAQLTNAEVVASPGACDCGLAPADLRIGLGARPIDSEIYLLFASSGAEGHLAALAAHTMLFAVDSNPSAPIFEVADFGLVADAEQTIEQLITRFRAEDSAPTEG